MENIVAIEWLRRKSMNPLLDFFYWKDTGGKEVDFVVKEGKNIRELIQVCYDVEDYDTIMRETKALLKASNKLTCKNLKIITWDYEDDKIIDKKTIKFIPIWKWLLDLT